MKLKITAWCYDCKKEREVAKIYFDKAKTVLILKCGHDRNIF